VSFLEQMAAGLTDLAAALDEAKRSAEPARFNTAARITHNLQQAVMQWLENNAGNRIGTVLDVALFTGSVLFLHSLGADSVAVREADWGLSGQRVLWICACETT
jgi:hypothetical protein